LWLDPLWIYFGLTKARGTRGVVRVAFSRYVNLYGDQAQVKPRSRIIVKKPPRLKESKD
jgi:hypothetical protein